MISKERLEELIKEGAIIYTSRFKKPEKYKLYKDYFVNDDELCACNKSHTAIECVIKLKKLFETKEEAEFALKYQNITRTETLSLPTWEEIIKEVVYEKNIYGYDRKNYVLIIENYANEPTIQISCSNDYFGIFEAYDKPLTKESYIEACELCRKLFLGEEV